MQDNIDSFLGEVDEQIACKLCHEDINQELRGHIEDKAEDYRKYGLSEEEAVTRAIRDMGQPDVIGMELNRQHRVRVAWPLLGIIGLLLVIGFTEMVLFEGSWSSPADLISSLLDGKYYLWGLALLLFVMYKGYPFLLRHAGTVVKTMGIFCGALAVGGLSQKLLMSYGAENALLYRLYRSGFQVLILGLGVPVSAVWLYRKRADGMRTIALLALAQAFLSGVPSPVPGLPAWRILDPGAGVASDLPGNGAVSGGQRLAGRKKVENRGCGSRKLCSAPDLLGCAGKPGAGAVESLYPPGGLRVRLHGLGRQLQ